MNSNSDSILELDQFYLQPFQELTGRVRLHDTTRDQSLELRLFWFTEGRGDEEAEIAEVVSIPASSETYEFSLKLPKGPYSFAGQLITLAWALELVDKKERSLALVPFQLSPNGEEIQLPSIKKKEPLRERFLRRKK